MVELIKSGLLSSTGVISPQKLSPTSGESGGFGDFLKTDMKDFLHKTTEFEGMMTNYVSGLGDIEEIAPKLKELMLEFEVKTKIISSLANIIKSLTSMNI